MKLQLFQEIVELNQSFDRLIEIARVYANREFFDNFEKIVEDDAEWAYRFQRAFDEKLKDRDDIYLEVRDSEQRRKRKRLPPRVVILPDWDMSDEDRYDEKGKAKRKRPASKRRRSTRKSSKELRSRTHPSSTLETPEEGGRRL